MTGAYLNIQQPDITASPAVTLRTSSVTGEPFAIVELGDGMHLSMHLTDASQARALAAAFTEAADLLDAAATEDGAR